MGCVMVKKRLNVGMVGYGASLALFVLALRDLGTARTGAYFSTAPFFGAASARPRHAAERAAGPRDSRAQ